MDELLGDALARDVTYLKAKKNILEVVEKYKEKIKGVRPPFAGFKSSYEEIVKNISILRGQELFYPFIGSGFGKGALVELADGSIKYDFISGIGIHWGHCHPELVAAGIDASIQNIIMQSNLQYNRDTYALMSLLTKVSGFDHCFLTTSGAMANENALKIIFQKKAPAYRLLAFERCFMGRTLSLAQITDKPLFREGLPSNLSVDYVPFYEWKDPKGSTERAILSLKKHLSRYPGAHAGMCFEMIQGEAGSYPGTQEFFIEIMKILKKQSIAIFVDEIQTFGRTDRLFAFQHFGLEEFIDLVTCGKLMHVCSTLFRTNFKPKPGLIAQTFISPSSSIRAATAIIHSLLEDGHLGIQGKNMRIRKRFVDRLQALADKYPHQIEGPFGHGLMIACTPFKGEKEIVVAFAKALFDAGLITYTSGADPTRLRFLVPPGGVTEEDIDGAASILEQTLVNQIQ